jgi:hypothetical protein
MHESNFFKKNNFDIYISKQFKSAKKIISRIFFKKITKYCFNRKNKQPFIFAIKKCF